MNLFYISNISKNKAPQELIPEIVNYILPNSGKLRAEDVDAKTIYVNGLAVEIDKTWKYEIKSESLKINVGSVNYEIRILCDELQNAQKLDYKHFGSVFNQNLKNSKLNSASFFKALNSNNEKTRISLCTFDRKFVDINRMSTKKMYECVKDFPHIFHRPRIHLKQINEVRPASVVTRIGQESIRHLASHSEHWKGIKASGLIPERLLARILEDDFAIYENVVVKTIVDHLYKNMINLKQDTLDCSMQLGNGSSYSLGGEQRNYYDARKILMRGMDDNKVLEQQELLEEQLHFINLILDILRECKSTPLYRQLRRQKNISGKLRKTNIFMMDKYYKSAYKLWLLMEEEKNQSTSIYDEVQDIDGEYELYCKVLFVFALKFFNYNLIERDDDIFDGNLFSDDLKYKFEYWNLSLSNETVLDAKSFSAEIFIKTPIEINLAKYSLYNYSDDNNLGFENNNSIFVFEEPLTDKKQNVFVKGCDKFWNDKNDKEKKKIQQEVKQVLHEVFSNQKIPKRKILFIPWKYALPDNTEDLRQLLAKIKFEIKKLDFDKIFLLVLTKPSELKNIKDNKALNSILDYGWAQNDISNENGKIGVVHIGIGDINSYRRFTKILLEQMILIDPDKTLCPTCGEKLTKTDNIWNCYSCGLKIFISRCSNPECKREYYFTRYDLPPISTLDSNDEFAGFKILEKENLLGFKNITLAHISEENGEKKIIPVCPYCGKI